VTGADVVGGMNRQPNIYRVARVTRQRSGKALSLKIEEDLSGNGTSIIPARSSIETNRYWVRLIQYRPISVGGQAAAQYSGIQ
jgi:hypothetical protein